MKIGLKGESIIKLNSWTYSNKGSTGSYVIDSQLLMNSAIKSRHSFAWS